MIGPFVLLYAISSKAFGVSNGPEMKELDTIGTKIGQLLRSAGKKQRYLLFYRSDASQQASLVFGGGWGADSGDDFEGGAVSTLGFPEPVDGSTYVRTRDGAVENASSVHNGTSIEAFGAFLGDGADNWFLWAVFPGGPESLDSVEYSDFEQVSLCLEAIIEVATINESRIREERKRLASIFRRTSGALESFVQPSEMLGELLDDLIEAVEVEAVCGILGTRDDVEFVVERSSGATQRSYSPEYLDRDEIWDVQTTGRMTTVEFPGDDKRRAGDEVSRAMRVLACPIISRDKSVGMLVLESHGMAPFEEDTKEVTRAFASQAAVALENAELYAELTHLARVDELTGLWNRRYCFELARRECKRARRHGDPLVALMVDLDRFSRINDSYGHPIGDRILKVVASRCKERLRDIDVLGRYGGEEFLIMLPHTKFEHALNVVAHRIRRCIKDEPIQTESGPIDVTASVGVSEFNADRDSLEDLIWRADQMLTVAKQRGRDRVISRREVEALDEVLETKPEQGGSTT